MDATPDGACAIRLMLRVKAGSSVRATLLLIQRQGSGGEPGSI
jgi:hypothetical protein